jgi:hypothetical protein
MHSFKNFLKSESSWGSGAILNTPTFDTQRMAGHPLSMPNIDISIPPPGTITPYVTKKSIVKSFIYNKNPIYIELKDKTKLFMSLPEYKRIKGDLPIIPDLTELTVYFQRLPHDLNTQPSQIIFCKSKFTGDINQRKIHRIGMANFMDNEVGAENPVDDSPKIVQMVY